MEELNSVQQYFCDQSNERALLALAVNNTDNFYNLLSRITEEDFLSPDSRKLFYILKVLHSKGVKSFDVPAIVRVAEELNYTDLCDLNYTKAITNINVASDNFDVYLTRQLDIVTKFKLHVSLDKNLGAVKANANLTSEKTSNDLLSIAQSELLTLSSESLSVDEPRHVGEGLDEYIESIKDNKITMRGISTGFPILDRKIDGQLPGTLFIVAARKKMGKSTLLTNMASYTAIEERRPVLYVDTEMPFDQWRSRVLAIISGVKERDILHGGFADNKDLSYKISEAAKKLRDSKLFHQYLPGYSVEKLAALYQKYRIQEKIELGVFDYIKEPESSSVDGNRKEYQILGDVTTKLKDLSGQLDIPITAAVQVNRTGDVADSDRVARYGDIVAFWEMRDLAKLEEMGEDPKVCGHYQLSIRDSRRGGFTNAMGIGYQFYHKYLTVREVQPPDQLAGLFDQDEQVDGIDQLVHKRATKIEDDYDNNEAL